MILTGPGLKGILSLLGCLIFTSCVALDSRVIMEDPPDLSAGFDDVGLSMAGPEKRKTGPKAGKRLAVSVEDAILIALENNRSLRIERMNPSIRRTFEDQERALFDPVLTGDAALSRDKGPQTRSSSPPIPDNSSSAGEIGLGASRFFPSGTDVSVDLSGNRSWSDLYSDRYESRVGLSVTQALLQGRGLDVNLANLRQAKLGTRLSQYELRGFAEALVASIEETYWDYALSQHQIRIFEESMRLAERQLKETEEIIKVGRMAETEIIASQAELALRRQELILARTTMQTTRLRLLRLLNPPGANLWDREIHLLEKPAVPKVDMDDVNTHVKVALRMRPDLNQARLGVKIGELEIVKTKNGLLPKMDLFITLGKTGYADSFGSSVSNITGDGFDILTGLTFRFPFRNRDARARHGRAMISLDQTEEAVDNLSQLVELDVRTAYIELVQTMEQIDASRATRQLEEEKLRVETEKFRVGRSTNFLVAQAQRDLVRSQISEIRSVANVLKAFVRLHRVEGSLLERRGIRAPGKEPVGDDNINR